MFTYYIVKSFYFVKVALVFRENVSEDIIFVFDVIRIIQLNLGGFPGGAGSNGMPGLPGGKGYPGKLFIR